MEKKSVGSLVLAIGLCFVVVSGHYYGYGYGRYRGYSGGHYGHHHRPIYHHYVPVYSTVNTSAICTATGGSCQTLTNCASALLSYHRRKHFFCNASTICCGGTLFYGNHGGYGYFGK